MTRLAWVLLLSSLAVMPANAQSFFSDSFDGGAISASLENGGGYAVSAPDPSGNRFVYHASGARSYVRTVDTNYNTVDFDYRIDFNNAVNPDIFFVGLGDGVPDTAFYNEPDHAIGFHIDPPDAGQTQGTVNIVGQNHDIDQGPPYTVPHIHLFETTIGSITPGAYTAEIRKSGDTLTFAVLQGGTVVCSGTKSLSQDAAFLDSTTSRLYFGTSSPNIAFDNVRVTGSAPASANLLADAGFEGQSGGALGSPWFKDGVGNVGVDFGVGKAHTGANNGWISTTGGWTAPTQNVSVQANTDYALTAWVRDSGDFGTNGYLTFYGSDGVKRETAFGPTGAYANGYQQVRVNFNSGSATRGTVYIGLTNGSPQGSWLQADDISLAAR